MGRGKSKNDTGPELSPQEKIFVNEYIKTLNAADAARRAGYADTTADKKAPMWVTESAYKPEINKGHVYEAVNALLQERLFRVQVDADYVLNSAVEILERCMQRAPVLNTKGEQKTDENGNGIWRFDSAGANRAIENLTKLMGLNREDNRVGAVTVNVSVPDETAQRKAAREMLMSEMEHLLRNEEGGRSG